MIPTIANKYIVQEKPNQIIPIFNFIHQNIHNQMIIRKGDLSEEDTNEEYLSMIKGINLKYDAILPI